MNGVAESLLEELIKQASAQTVLLRKMAASSGATATGPNSFAGAAAAATGMGKSVSALSIGLNVFKIGIDLVSGAISNLSSFVGNIAGHFVNLGVNLYEFSKKAAEGKARLSDLYDAFKDLPLYIGPLMSIFADMIRYQERLLDVYRKVTESGASFGGSLDAVRTAAVSAYLTLDEFVGVVRKNSDAFSGMGLSVAAGIEKFSSANAKLIGPESEFNNAIFGMGYTAEQASDMLAGMIRSQGVMSKNGAASTDQLAKLTFDYMTELDQLSKITGKRREQIDEEVKKAEDDKIFQLYLESLSPEKAAAVRSTLAASFAAGGKDLMEMTKNQIRGIDTPLNEAATKIAVATGGLSIQQGDAVRKIVNNVSLSAEQRTQQLSELYGKLGVKAAEFGDVLGTQGQAIMGNQLLPEALIQTGINTRNAGKTVTKSLQDAAADQLKSRISSAQSLGNTEQNIKLFGMAFQNLVYKFIEPLMPTLLSIGSGLTDFLNKNFKEGSPLSNSVKSVVTWLTESASMIKQAFGPDQNWKEAISKTIERIGNGLSNVWEVIKPGFEKAWEAMKPTIVKLFKAIFELAWEGIKEALGFGDDANTKAWKSEEKKAATSTADWAKQYQAFKNDVRSEEARDAQANPDSFNPILADYEIYKKFQQSRTDLFPTATQQKRHSGTIGMTGNWWEKKDATLEVQAGESVVTQSQMDQIVNTASQSGMAQSIQQLNSLTAQMLSVMKQTAENTKRTYDATRALNGDLFQIA